MLYLIDYIEKAYIISHLMDYIDKLSKSIANLKKHKKETLSFVPIEYRTMVSIIFSHHESNTRRI